MGSALTSIGRRLGRFGRVIGDALTPEEELALIQTPPFMPSASGETDVEYGLDQSAMAPSVVPPTFQPRQTKPGWKGVLMAGLQGAIDGASTPNVAYGGPTDIMRAASNASEMARQRQMQAAQMQRQRTNDAYLMNRDKRADEQLEEQKRRNLALEKAAEAKRVQDAEKAIEKDAHDIVKDGKGEFVKDPTVIPDEMRPFMQEYSVGGQKRYIRMFTEDERAEREFKTKMANAKRAGLAEGSEAWKKAVLGAAYLAPEKQTTQNLVVRDITNDITGTVTRRFYNPATGNLVKEEKLEGMAQKRPPAGPSSEPGTWVAETDNFGNIVRYRNNKTLEARTPEDVGNRKSGLPAGERKELASGASTLQNLDELERLAKGSSSSIGPIAGRITAMQKDYTGTSTSAENQLFQLSGMIADDLLRMKSGAQINETEMARLQKLVPVPTQPYKTFMDNLKKLREETQRILENRKGPTAEASQPIVKVRHPRDGKVYGVPADKLEEKLRQGFTRVE